MRVLSLFTALSFVALNLIAQSVTWQRSFTCENLTQGHSVCANENSCFTLSEVSNGLYGQSDLVVTKRTLFGQIIWNRIVGSSRIESGMNAVIELLSDESVFIIGFSKQNSLDDRDVFCCKLSSDGNILWSKTIPFLNGNEVPRDVIELVNGDLLIVGSIVSQSFGSNDGFISRIDPTGNVIWAKNIGGSQNDHFYGVQEMSDCILVAGNCQSLDGVHLPDELGPPPLP